MNNTNVVNMKKSKLILIFILILSVLLSLTACMENEVFSLINSISAEQIETIAVSYRYFELYEPVVLTDVGEIEIVTNYLRELKPGARWKMGRGGSGGGHFIEIHYKDGTLKEVYLFGNTAIIVGKNSHKLSYEEASAFDAVIGGIILNRHRVEYDGTIIRGEVVSVSADPSGRSIACVVKTDDGVQVKVNMKNVTHTLTITGAGWLILHVGDEVEIGVDEEFVADMVFITSSAMQE